MSFTPFTEADQPTMVAFNKKLLEAIGDAVGKSAQLEIGTYQGTGQYGVSNPVSISFQKKLLFAAVVGVGELGIFIPAYRLTGSFSSDGYYTGGDRALQFNNTNQQNKFARIIDGGKTVQFYNTGSPQDQANATGSTYIYIGFLDSTGGEI